jgi:hypothetical protein
MGTSKTNTHSTQAPPASRLFLRHSPRQKVVAVYRERIREYKGPCVVTYVNGMDIKVELEESTGLRSFNSCQVKPWPLLNHEYSLPGPRLPLAMERPPIPYLATVLSTEAIYPTDHRAALFDDAKRAELCGLIEIWHIQFSIARDAETHPNIIPSLFVLSTKSMNLEMSDSKQGFMLGGHRDCEKKSLITQSTTLKHQSVRLIMAFCIRFWIRALVARR